MGALLYSLYYLKTRLLMKLCYWRSSTWDENVAARYGSTPNQIKLYNAYYILIRFLYVCLLLISTIPNSIYFISPPSDVFLLTRVIFFQVGYYIKVGYFTILISHELYIPQQNPVVCHIIPFALSVRLFHSYNYVLCPLFWATPIDANASIR